MPRTTTIVVMLLVASPAGAQPAAPDPAAVSEAPARAPEPPAGSETAHLLHVPPGDAVPAKALRLVAVIDGHAAEPTLVARYRGLGSGAPFRDAAFERSSAGGWYATIPAAAVTRPGLEYYIAGHTTDGREVLHYASGIDPHPVVVEPSWQTRMAETDLARMNGRLDVVSFDYHVHDFGNRYGNRDDVMRGEGAWTHHFLRALYSVTMGYGFVRGKTPDAEGRMAGEVLKAAHYGFGEARLRLNPSIFIDARAEVGVDKDSVDRDGLIHQGGFVRGVGTAITFGRPWQSSVSLGGEVLENLGATGWVRLQWDTAPPFLMGASIVKTDLPGAILEDGLYLKYDVSYAILDRLGVRVAVSYGSRDGRARFGAGLGSWLAF